MKSCVKSQSHKSEWFPVLQGTGQGVLSPFLYLVYAPMGVGRLTVRSLRV